MTAGNSSHKSQSGEGFAELFVVVVIVVVEEGKEA